MIVLETMDFMLAFIRIVIKNSVDLCIFDVFFV